MFFGGFFFFLFLFFFFLLIFFIKARVVGQCNSNEYPQHVPLGQRKLIIRFLSPSTPKNSDQIKYFEVEIFFRDNWTFAENRFYTTFKNCKWIIVMKRVLK